MNRHFSSLLAVLVCFGTLPIASVPAATPEPSAARIQDLEWVELLPAAERSGYVPGPPPARHDYLNNKRPFGNAARDEEPECIGIARRLNPECDIAMPQMSSAVNTGLDGRLVRLSGYIVPLEVQPNGNVTEFFLAAYVGACIHVPAPPPNQMVYVKVKGGQGVRSMYDAYAMTGVLHTQGKIVGIGGAAYTLEVKTIQRLR